MVEEGNLALKTEHRAVHPRQAEQGTSIVDEVPSWKIIGAVNDEVPALEAFQNVPRMKALVEYLDVHVRVKSSKRLFRRFNLRPAHILGCVENLALKVAHIDGVVVNQAQTTDSSGGEVQGSGRA